MSDSHQEKTPAPEELAAAISRRIASGAVDDMMFARFGLRPKPKSGASDE